MPTKKPHTPVTQEIKDVILSQYVYPTPISTVIKSNIHQFLLDNHQLNVPIAQIHKILQQYYKEQVALNNKQYLDQYNSYMHQMILIKDHMAKMMLDVLEGGEITDEMKEKAKFVRANFPHIISATKVIQEKQLDQKIAEAAAQGRSDILSVLDKVASHMRDKDEDKS